MTDYEQLIPELKVWKTDVDSWLSAIGRFDHMVAYGRILWPEFKLHQDCILFADCPISAFDTWMTSTGGETHSVEGVLNHRHIVDLFPNSELEPTKDIVLYLGRLLKDMWSCKLSRDFPGRPIIVSFDETDSEDLLDYQITFFHETKEV